MGGKGEHAGKLAALLDKALKGGKTKEVEEYLAASSHLPGPRGNLELAEAFAEALESKAPTREEVAWGLSVRLAHVADPATSGNTPGEFVAFCGVRGIGVLGGLSEKDFRRAVGLLREFSSDVRWRVREAVAMSIQWLLVRRPGRILAELPNWIKDDGWLEMRAVAAGVAEPAPLTNPEVATHALGLHRMILDSLLKSKNRGTEQFRSLRQTLGYSLSVIAVAKPRETFSYVEELVKTRDKDILWIVRENLKKSRVRRNFPKEVEAIEKLVG